MIDLSRFKVIYGEKVLNAIALLHHEVADGVDLVKDKIIKLEFLTLMVVGTDGNIEVISDEAWMFQFIPIVTK